MTIVVSEWRFGCKQLIASALLATINCFGVVASLLQVVCGVISPFLARSLCLYLPLSPSPSPSASPLPLTPIVNESQREKNKETGEIEGEKGYREQDRERDRELHYYNL